MNITILRRESDLSGDAELLARVLEPLGVEVFVTYKNRPSARHNTHVLRWGCTDRYPEVVGTTINSSKAIQSVSNKGLWRASMQMQHMGSLIPRTYFDSRMVPWEEDTQWILRPTKHARGREFHIVTSRTQVYELQQRLGSVYIQEKINVSAEYRILFVNRKIVQVVQRDVRTTGRPVPQNENNVNNIKWGQWPLPLLQRVQPLIDSCDLTFGAMDVMVNDQESTFGYWHDMNIYVSEINSAPEIYPYSATCLAKALVHDLLQPEDMAELVPNPTSYRNFIHPALVT